LKNHSEKKHLSQGITNRFHIFVWTLFDFANTSFSIVVVTFIFAVYFKNTIAGGESIGDFFWSLATSISMFITAIISPILGAISDPSAGKKRFLLFFTLLCILSTSLLYFTGPGDIVLAIVLFVFANIGFEAGLVFYDSFLPEITQPKNYGRVSGYGYGMGYLGSLVTLAILFPLINLNFIKETFPTAALFFLVFSLPLFIFLKDSRQIIERTESYFKIGFNRVKNTLTHLRAYKNLSVFLIAFFFYIEGVNTVIFFSGIYASTTLGFDFTELIIFFIVVQTTAILGSIVFGIISDSIGQKKAIIISLLIWMFTIVMAFLTSSKEAPLVIYFSDIFKTDGNEILKNSFYIVGLFAGSVMGATQSTSRSLMTRLTPLERKTEFFGFYSFFGKSSAIIGPLIFGLVSYFADSQPIAILTVGIFFIIGLVILLKVKEE